jgi:acyl transferase domain-containing protein/NADPH:quinone reductase-like Zn-dependent oxidoreductase/acyl carrier protein/short-subunit dehydrogenase/SAM-dependent methyltransferase
MKVVAKKTSTKPGNSFEARKDILAQRDGGAVVPVAIIGNAFRFPDDHSDESLFWNALKKKQDFIGQIPSDRWATSELQHDKSSESGRASTFSAGVLSDIDKFDAGFFGISPREAAWLDPQQRLLLELSWEAMENAGVLPSSLAGSDCAVYVGISSLDYGTRGLDDLASLSSHYMTGNTLSMAANRLSYIFDLHGPSLAIDAACSSSMVALHHACNCLRTGEASSAIVGGVSLLLHPYPFVGFTKASMLSAYGRSKTFDASANGYVRSEGGAVVMLKPLDRALAEGDEIQAVILGSGINTDGARKTGITIPSRDGQAELMGRVLGQSGLSANEVDYVEAHGTGTSLGDPIEAAAIAAVYGQGRAQALPIGSVKANLGHMEAASGMAGLIKALLVIKNRELPPALHLNTPNPNIDFEGLNLELVTEHRDLVSESGKPLVVGVNSFGFGGSNAHVLLQEPLRQVSEETVSLNSSLPPLVLSARSDDALRDMVERYATILDGKSLNDYYDITYAAAYQRDHLGKRLALVAGTIEEGTRFLSCYAQGESPKEIIIEKSLPQSGSVAFVYSGNGSQWIGMGRRLLAESSRFLEIITRLDTKISPLTGYSVIEELNADGTAAHLDDTVVAQPLLFVIQVACTLLLKELGVEPAAVTGHSVGEIAAAWAAGALDLDQAIRIIVARSTAQGKTRSTGKMAAVGLSEAGLEAVLQELGGDLDVTIAGINSPGHLTLSGSLVALEGIQAYLRPKGVFFRLLDIDYAFHSRQMDPIKESLEQSLTGLKPSPTNKTIFVSTVEGDILSGSALDARYWWRNVREPVRFAEGVAKLADLGCRTFIEIGPRAILKHYITECLVAADVQARVLSMLRRGADGQDKIVETALRAHLLADQPNLDVFFPKPGRRVRLPNYPWQRERHWHPSTSECLGAITRRRVHPLLGWRLHDAEMAWENNVDPISLPWLEDHKVGGTIVFPGSAYAEMALAAAREWLDGERLVIEAFDIVSPMVFVGENARTVRFILNPRDGGFQIRSRQRLSTDEWTLHAAGRVLEAADWRSVTCLASIPEPKKKVERETHYRLASALGLDYGPAFQGLAEAYVSEDRLEAVFAQAQSMKLDDGYLIHPAILDVCFQTLVDFFQAEIEMGQGAAFLPVKIGCLDLHRYVEVSRLQAHLRRRGKRSVLVDFELLDESGELVARLTDCRFRVSPLLHSKKSKVSTWNITPVLCPHTMESLVSELPSANALVSLSREGLVEVEEQRRIWFKESLPLSELLTLSFAYEAFQVLAQKEQEGLQCLVEKDSPYVRWLTGLLRQEGLLHERDGQWFVTADSDLPEAEVIWHTLLDDNPSCLPQLVMLGRVGRHLPEILTGATSSREFLTVLQDSPVADTLFNEDPAYLGIRLALENTLCQLANSWPKNRRLRVLEIAAGPSELPRRLLDELPEDRLDYVLALDNEKYCERQQVEYQEFANVTLASFSQDDWELTADKPIPKAFDVIVLRHVLHKAGNPHAALAQAQRWLTAGGVLMLAERHPDWSADLVAGLEPAWWHECNPEETGTNAPHISSLLAPDAWLQALGENGFDDIGKFVEAAADSLAEGAFLLFAKRPLADVIVLPDSEAEAWLLLVDDASKSVADNLRVRLESLGHNVAVTEQMREHDLVDVRHVVSFIGWISVPEDAASLLTDLLANVQVLGALTNQPPRLWIVTCGGALASGLSENCTPNLVQTAFWGFGRVVMNEYPALDCTLIDLASDPNAQDVPFRLENEFLYPDGENEIILASTARYTLVMNEEDTPSTAPCGSETHYRLDFNVPGKLRNAIWFPEKEHPLQDEEIEVGTKATGLNFRDIMYLMGLLPDEAVENGFAGASLGLEFSGIVTRVGSQVRDLRPGDAVMGFGSSCFASHVITLASAVVPMPGNWSFEAAATVPTVYLTVYYALQHLADLQPGERVLIHGAAGGVGIAAIRLARHLGAEIFATAGKDEKRDFVRLLGADHVFDSRSLAFADDILAVTGGEGVDVVLNSLSGEAIRRNLSVLRPFGRFLELGKRDFYENTPVGLRFFKDNVSYFGIDVDQLFLGRPQLAARLFRGVMELFQEGVLTPLPYRVFKADRTVDAFYEMMEARHIGKVVVSFEGARPHIHYPAPVTQAVQLEKSSTWIVTGGLDGFGLESARWIASRGVGNLVLISRRGQEAPGANEVIAELADLGVNALAISCDVTDAKALSMVIDHVRKTMPPLKGILHAAMVIDDQLIMNLNGQSIEAVLAPKLMGAWNLHSLTLDIPLEYFVLYSSITTSIGNPGQANYVTANAALEGLAQMRRSMELPVTCVGWGPIGNVGYLTRNTDVRDSLGQRLGKPPLTADEALTQLDKILTTDDGSPIVANFDWRVLSNLLPSATSSRFGPLNYKVNDAGSFEEATDLRALIANKTPEEITSIVRSVVIQEVAQVLLVKVDRIEANSSLHDYGLDSLMAVDLAHRLEQSFGIQLPVMMLNESPTAVSVALCIIEKLSGNTANDVDNQTEALVHDVARQHGEEMTESDILNILERDQEVAMIDGSQIA